LASIGVVYRRLGKAEEEKEMFTKAYSIFLKVLGPNLERAKKLKIATVMSVVLHVVARSTPRAYS